MATFTTRCQPHHRRPSKKRLTMISAQVPSPSGTSTLDFKSSFHLPHRTCPVTLVSSNHHLGPPGSFRLRLQQRHFENTITLQPYLVSRCSPTMQQTHAYYAHHRVARDSSPQSQDAYYDPSTVVLCLVALCLVLLAPTLLILWRGRPNRRQGKLLPLLSNLPSSVLSPSYLPLQLCYYE